MPAAIAWGNFLTNASAVNLTEVGGAYVSYAAADTAAPMLFALDPDPSKVCRINYTRDATVGGFVVAEWAFASTLALSGTARVLALENVRLPPGFTEVQLYARNYLNVQVAYETILAADLVPKPGTTDRYDVRMVIPAGVSCAEVGVAVMLPPSTAGYIEVGHVWASDALVLDGTEENWTVVPVDGSDVERSKGGAHLADPFAVRDVFRAALPKLSEAQAFGSAASPTAPSIRRLQKEAGRNAPVLLLPRTSSQFWLQTSGVYGALRNVPTLRHVSAAEFESEVEVEEIT